VSDTNTTKEKTREIIELGSMTLERTTSLSVSPVDSPLEATVHYQFGCFERETA